MWLYVINGLAAVFFVLGYHVAFRQRAIRAWSARLPFSQGDPDAEARAFEGDDREEIGSVFRIFGVMIMAMSFISAAFADLIAYYSSTNPL